MKNDRFWSRSFLTPLVAWKTWTNIGKQLGISQNPTKDPKSIKIELYGQILWTLKWPWAWNWVIFLLFYQFLPIFSIQWYSGYPQWGILMGKFVPTGCWVHWIEKIGRNWEKRKKMIFHALFMDMDLSWPQTCSHWPKMVVLVLPVRYFNGQVCFYRFLGPLDTKYWKKLRKKSKNDFSDQISGIRGHFKVGEIWS